MRVQLLDLVLEQRHAKPRCLVGQPTTSIRRVVLHLTTPYRGSTSTRFVSNETTAGSTGARDIQIEVFAKWYILDRFGARKRMPDTDILGCSTVLLRVVLLPLLLTAR